MSRKPSAHHSSRQTVRVRRHVVAPSSYYEHWKGKNACSLSHLTCPISESLDEVLRGHANIGLKMDFGFLAFPGDGDTDPKTAMKELTEANW